MLAASKGWENFTTVAVGKVKVRAGEVVVQVKAVDEKMSGAGLMNLRGVEMERVGG